MAYEITTEQLTLKLTELYEKYEDLDVLWIDNFFYTGQCRMFELGDKFKTIRVFICDGNATNWKTFEGIRIEVGKETYGVRRFSKMARYYNAEDKVHAHKDHHYNSQDIFELHYPFEAINDVINVIKYIMGLK